MKYDSSTFAERIFIVTTPSDAYLNNKWFSSNNCIFHMRNDNNCKKNEDIYHNDIFNNKNLKYLHTLLNFS